MATYKTPGVYTEEISTLPPSVADVSTAVPAFLGYTEKGPKNEPTVINTLLEYEQTFGKAQPTAFTATVAGDGSISIQENGGQRFYLLYYCLSMYFKNGGGKCYVISVGSYSATPAKTDFEDGLAALAKEDEPTLILLTDAVNLSANNHADYYDLCVQSLGQCARLKDRFCIFDVLDDKVDEFRQGIGSNDLKYGAAYTPYLRTSLNYAYRETGVTVSGAGGTTFSYETDPNGITVTYTGAETAPKVRILVGTGDPLTFEIVGGVLTIRNVGTGAAVADVLAAWTTWKTGNDASGFDIAQAGDGSADVISPGTGNQDMTPGASPSLASIKDIQTQLYNQVKTELAKQRVTLPPSAAVAGLYAKVDRERGVWKAPANVSVASVIGPTLKITHEEQENLNVDPTAGKSINAIRSFTGKGTLVWGARTLAGNDNEWRYVNVRRLFNMIEESIQKATSFAVFEPNDAGTWLKVKAMIDAYLTGLWEQGALAGSTPETAFFVNVGLGKTMTPQDILNGRMIVEVGIAAVRPAEFIILRFSHKMQEA